MPENDRMEEPVIFSLTDEEGNEVEFHLLDVVPYKGEEYVVLIENTEDADECVILKIENPTDEEEVYTSIDDEELLNEIFEEFKRLNADEFDFE